MCETVMAVSQLDIESHPPENGFVTPETDKRQGLLSQIDNRVLPHLGGFGRFQKLLVLLTCIPAIFIGFSQFSDSFLLYVPHPCAQVQPNSSNVSAVANGNDPTNGSSSSSSSSQCVCTQSGCQLQIGLEQNVVTKRTIMWILNNNTTFSMQWDPRTSDQTAQ